MIKLPFSRKSKDDLDERPVETFTRYCDDERERLRDAGEPFDEARFQAAVDLALARLQARERGESK
jgi:hypothetical protein